MACTAMPAHRGPVQQPAYKSPVTARRCLDRGGVRRKRQGSCAVRPLDSRAFWPHASSVPLNCRVSHSLDSVKCWASRAAGTNPAHARISVWASLPSAQPQLQAVVQSACVWTLRSSGTYLSLPCPVSGPRRHMLAATDMSKPTTTKTLPGTTRAWKSVSSNRATCILAASLGDRGGSEGTSSDQANPATISCWPRLDADFTFKRQI